MATYLNGLFIQELLDLYKINYRDLDDRVTNLIREMRRDERWIVDRLGRAVSGLDLLEIGPGQRSPYQYYFSNSNSYVGIDIEPLQTGSLIAGVIDDLRKRGSARALKTLGRRLLGVDRRFHSEMCRRLRIDARAGEIVCMEAGQMEFEDDSFDLVLSRSVFEHLPEPKLVMSEISRVLRPGGMAYIITHLYTSDSGIHDTRIFSGNRGGIPFWAHLRPEQQHKVRANSYLNKIRLDQYRKDFERYWPGVEHHLIEDAGEDKKRALEGLRNASALSEYSDEELLSTSLISIWRKPEALPARPNGELS
jgi:SAM-dependent methyltransferase